MSRLLKIRLLLLAVILLVFGRTIGSDFVDWDDGKLIYLNENLTPPTWSGLARHWNPQDISNTEMFDPLVYTTWWGLAHISQLETPDVLGGRLNPYVFHVANLLVHWLVVCVVLEILRKFKLSDWAATGGALIFAVHPLQAEAVAWATAMKDLLSGLFAMLTIWQYMAAVEATGRKRRNCYLIASLCLIGALLSKPSTVTIPCIVAAIDLLYFHRPLKLVATWIAPWIVPAVIITCIAVKVQPVRHIFETRLWLRPMISLDALAFYLYKLLLPVRLSFDYGRNPGALLRDSSLHHPLLWTWIFPVLVAFLVLRARKPLLTIGGVIFLFGTLPVLGLSPFVFQFYSTVADRYVYVPMLGVSLAVANFLSRHPSRRIVIGFCAVLAGLCSLSFAQAGIWKDSRTLYENALSLNRTQAVHYMIYGEYEHALGNSMARQATAARKHGALADWRDLSNLAKEHWEQSIALLKTAIHLKPELTNSYDKLAAELVELNRTEEAIDIVQEWTQAEQLIDDNQREPPGKLDEMLGTLYLRVHRYPEAIEELQKSLQIQSDPEVEKALALARKMAASTRPGGVNSSQPANPAASGK